MEQLPELITMKLVWFVVFLVALVCGAFGQECPQGFQQKDGQCVTSRPVHGQCPPSSNYNINTNLCVASS
uniref:Chitin-binding type-2 domain-containing protein n=1 Tax=Anopheles farauti TaxID=69004 RepID=A0A182QLM5_9DIPT